MDVDKQSDYIHRKIKQLQDDSNSHTDVVDKVEEFLFDGCSSLNLRPFNVQQDIDGSIRIRWDYDLTHVNVLFFADCDDWHWDATTIHQDTSMRHLDANNSYVCSYSHHGMCSFRVKNTPYYALPDVVEQLISTSDEFKGLYHPLLKKHEYHVNWVTNRYDGMLSGYCSLKGKLHYFDNVEETPYQRKRMFAVYELSYFERIKAHIQHHQWNIVSTTSWMWAIKMWIYRHTALPTSNAFHKSKQSFIKSHPIVGYFDY